MEASRAQLSQLQETEDAGLQYLLGLRERIHSLGEQHLLPDDGDQIQLARKVQLGNAEAARELVRSSRVLINFVLTDYANGRAQERQIVLTAAQSLLKAASRYDPYRHGSFAEHAGVAIVNGLQETIPLSSQETEETTNSPMLEVLWDMAQQRPSRLRAVEICDPQTQHDPGDAKPKSPRLKRRKSYPVKVINPVVTEPSATDTNGLQLSLSETTAQAEADSSGVTKRQPRRIYHEPDYRRLLDAIGKIPPLRPGEEQMLAARIEKGDMAAKQRMVDAHLSLVDRVVQQYSPSRDLNAELMNTGYFGLLSTFKTYDIRKGDFSSLAYFHVRKVVLDFLYRRHHIIRLPKNVIEDSLKLRKTEEKLARAGTMPTAEETANVLGWNLKKLSTIKNAIKPLESLNEFVGTEGETELGDLIEDDKQPDPYAEVIDAVTLIQVKQGALEELRDIERQVIILRYFDGLTQKEVAERLGCSQMHVSRAESRAIKELQISLDV